MFSEVSKALEIVNSGGTILYPTDTVWGIGCDATNVEAVRKIYELKQREDSKSLIILLPDVKSVFQYVANPYPDLVGLVAQFDRPTTVVYPQAIGLPENLINEDGSVAIRIVNDPFCKALLKRLKRPLVSTSANISGEPTANFFDEIDERIKAGIDYIVNWRRDDKTEQLPSKIIRVDADGVIELIRP